MLTLFWATFLCYLSFISFMSTFLRPSQRPSGGDTKYPFQVEPLGRGKGRGFTPLGGGFLNPLNACYPVSHWVGGF